LKSYLPKSNALEASGRKSTRATATGYLTYILLRKTHFDCQ